MRVVGVHGMHLASFIDRSQRGKFERRVGFAPASFLRFSFLFYSTRQAPEISEPRVQSRPHLDKANTTIETQPGWETRRERKNDNPQRPTTTAVPSLKSGTTLEVGSDLLGVLLETETYVRRERGEKESERVRRRNGRKEREGKERTLS